MFNKLFVLYNKYTWRFPFIIIAMILGKCTPLIGLIRKIRFRIFCKAQIGEKTVIENDVVITYGCSIEIGKYVFIGRRSIFDIGLNDDVKLTIGKETWISHDFHLHAINSMTIGEKVLIGEFVSVRDTSHNFDDPKKSVKDQGDTPGHIIIESGVWIGRGSLILGKPEGIIIGRDSIIAANSTVNCSIPPSTIWGGSPARFIKNR
jgi:acetyltransferase-like isoleucine patch superfamily enzyme